MEQSEESLNATTVQHMPFQLCAREWVKGQEKKNNGNGKQVINILFLVHMERCVCFASDTSIPALAGRAFFLVVCVALILCKILEQHGGDGLDGVDVRIYGSNNNNNTHYQRNSNQSTI